MEVDPDVLVTPPYSQPASAPLIQLTDRPIGRRERRAVTLHGFAARPDGSTVAVKLTDLSYDGCGIETTAELKPGERIQLSVLRRGGISAEVRWCANGRAGLIFDAAQPAQKRRLSRNAERVALTAEVALRCPGKRSYRARLLDISSHGCRVELVDRADVDDQAWVKFDGLEPLEAKVCWVTGFKAGLKFTNPIHPAVFDLLLARARARAGGAGTPPGGKG